jgi:hypothetical protein
MTNNKNTEALTKVIEALDPLDADERNRILSAVTAYFGWTASAAGSKTPGAKTPGVGNGDRDASIKQWMDRNGVSDHQLEQVFHFNGDGTFDIHDVPGSNNKAKTLNTYVLTGLGTYLATNSKAFTDDAARQFCKKIGCLDQNNHAATLKDKGAEFSGDKKKGYELTSVGMKRGADLVKELAGASK